MRFKVDENLPIEAADLLQQAGHDAVTVPGQGLGGQADPDIASICQREGRALVTLDTDFAGIRAYPPRDFPGLIVLRLKRQDKLHVLESLRHVTSVLSIEPLQCHLWIAEEGRVRIRS